MYLFGFKHYFYYNPKQNNYTLTLCFENRQKQLFVVKINYFNISCIKQKAFGKLRNFSYVFLLLNLHVYIKLQF